MAAFLPPDSTPMGRNTQDWEEAVLGLQDCGFGVVAMMAASWLVLGAPRCIEGISVSRQGVSER